MSKTAFIAAELQPNDETEAALFAQEDFIADIQVLLHDMMERKSVSRAELAKRLGVSKPRVSQFFAGDGNNLTARTIARIFHALGECAELTCEWNRRAADLRLADRRRHLILASGGVVTELRGWQSDQDWTEHSEGDCHEATDVSTLVAISRSRKPVTHSQAA